MTLMHYANYSIVREMNFGVSSVHLSAKLHEPTALQRPNNFKQNLLT
jgi:hypothetical protein